LYLAYLHNLGTRRVRRAPHARKEKNYWEDRISRAKFFGNTFPNIPNFLKRRNDGTWGYTHSLNTEPGIIAAVSNNHLKMFPYLRELVLRKNSPKIKGLQNINGVHYIEGKYLKNFSNVREAVKNRRKRQGVAAAEAKLKEVFNWARRRTAARNRGQFIGQMLKNQYEGTLFKPNNVMKLSSKKKSPSPPKPKGPLMRTESTKQREAQLGLAGAAKHPTGSPNNKRITWSRRANGTINIHKTIETLNMTLTPANLKRIGKMTIPNAQNEIRRLARLK
jgi:hypothetical protein